MFDLLAAAVGAVILGKKTSIGQFLSFLVSVQKLVNVESVLFRVTFVVVTLGDGHLFVVSKGRNRKGIAQEMDDFGEFGGAIVSSLLLLKRHSCQHLLVEFRLLRLLSAQFNC